jgi:RNA polymerase sigma factor (sigma-70 family)
VITRNFLVIAMKLIHDYLRNLVLVKLNLIKAHARNAANVRLITKKLQVAKQVRKKVFMEETKTKVQSVGEVSTDPRTTALLEQFLGKEAAQFIGILRSYISQYRLATGDEEVQDVALELFHDVYIEAMRSLTNFDPDRPPRAWLLGIAQNLVKRQYTATMRRKQNEISLSELAQRNLDQGMDTDPLERLFMQNSSGPEQQVEASENVKYLLSQVPQEYQTILRMWYIEDLEGAEIAERLGCSYSSAMVRLHRARKRLQVVILKEKGGRNG